MAGDSYDPARYQRNRERTLATNRRWRERNKPQLKVARHAKYLANADAVKAKSREYRLAHPDKRYPRRDMRAYNRTYYLKHRSEFIAATKEWQRRNPEKVRTTMRLVAGKRRAAGGTVTSAEWAWIVGAYRSRCAYCGAEGFLEMDHVIALTRGGTHEEGNIVPACRRCNARKNNRPVIVFLAGLAA